MKTSRFALAAVAGLALGTAAFSPSYAADLGGDCCADLEERVAELEATTARKGNRKVSLEVSGQVNRALLIWDDGIDSDAYIVDNNYSSSRFRFKGSAKVTDDVSAGFLIEIELTDTNSNSVDQFNDDDGTALNTRHTAWYVDSKSWGRVTLGQTSAATDDLTKISTANTLDDANTAFGGGFFVRDAGGGFSTAAIGDFADAYDLSNPNRDDVIRYDTPSIYGFILSASWGEDDVTELALRFKKEWNSIQIAAGVGYQDDERNGASSPIDGTFDGDRYDGGAGGYAGGNATFDERLFGALSMMHTPTGLFVTFSAGEEEQEFIAGALSDGDESFWFVQAGIEKNWFGMGKTTLYGHYGEYEDQGTDTDLSLVSSDVERFGFGLVQQIDAAAMEIYAQFNYFDVQAVDTAVIGGTLTAFDVDTEEFYGVMVGSRIKF